MMVFKWEGFGLESGNQRTRITFRSKIKPMVVLSSKEGINPVVVSRKNSKGETGR